MLFRSTENIFKDFNEVGNKDWQDKNFLDLPPSDLWDYKRELQIEDVDIWEVLYESTGDKGLYAAWQPYAEFYMVRNGVEIETFYGPKCQNRLKLYLKKLGIPYSEKTIWVDYEYEYLY